MSTYNDPVEQAKRLITFHKDLPWAQRELAELVPLLIEIIEKLEEDNYDAEVERRYYDYR